MSGEKNQRFYLTSDGDGHWYVVPVSKKSAFNRWLSNIAESIVDGSDEPQLPDGVIQVCGSYTLVTFEKPEVM